jgi:uncharacterized protein (TIGR03435 family)
MSQILDRTAAIGYQLTGPDFLNTERFDINVKVPKGATKEEYKVMLQNLLTERFKVTLHHEKKEMPVYELVVAKNGPKLKESKEELQSGQPDVNPEDLAETKLDAILKGRPGGPGGPPTLARGAFSEAAPRRGAESNRTVKQRRSI